MLTDQQRLSAAGRCLVGQRLMSVSELHRAGLLEPELPDPEPDEADLAGLRTRSPQPEAQSLAMPSVWIGYIEVPPSIETKIRTRRGVTGDQVRTACQWPAKPLRAGWHDHPIHGRRLLVIAWDEQGRLLRVILQPVDAVDGTWRLRTVLVGGEGA